MNNTSSTNVKIHVSNAARSGFYIGLTELDSEQLRWCCGLMVSESVYARVKIWWRFVALSIEWNPNEISHLYILQLEVVVVLYVLTYIHPQAGSATRILIASPAFYSRSIVDLFLCAACLAVRFCCFVAAENSSAKIYVDKPLSLYYMTHTKAVLCKIVPQLLTKQC